MKKSTALKILSILTLYGLMPKAFNMELNKLDKKAYEQKELLQTMHNVNQHETNGEESEIDTINNLQKTIILELHDDQNQSIAEIEIPSSFLKDASMIINNINDIEELNNDEKIVVPISTISISFSEFALLQSLIKELNKQESLNSPQDSLEKTVNSLITINNPSAIIAFYTIANYLGHEPLVTLLVKKLQESITQLILENKWSPAFTFIKNNISLPELRHHLVATLITLPEIKNWLSTLNQQIADIIIPYPHFSTFVSSSYWLCATFKEIEKTKSTINIWNLNNIIEKPSVIITNYRQSLSLIFSMAISPRDPLLVMGLKEGTFELYDIQTGKLHNQWHSPLNETIYSVYFSPSGKLLAGRLTNTITLWDIQNPQTIILEKTIDIQEFKTNCLAISPDDKILALGSENNNIYLWDIEKKELIQTLKGHTGKITSLIFSPKKNVLASASSDTTIKLWDLETGQATFTLDGDSTTRKPINKQGLQQQISSYSSTLDFSSNGKFLVSGFSDFMNREHDSKCQKGWNRQIKIWNIETGTLAKTISIDKPHNIFSVSISLDGTKVAYIAQKKNTDTNGKLKIIDIGLKDLKRALHNIPLESALILWYFALQRQKNEIIALPKGAEYHIQQLPIDIQNYFTNYLQLQRNGTLTKK